MIKLGNSTFWSTLYILYLNHVNTVEPVFKDHPIGHKNVVSQDRWSQGTGSIILKHRSLGQKWVVAQDRWSLKTGFTVHSTSDATFLTSCCTQIYVKVQHILHSVVMEDEILVGTGSLGTCFMDSLHVLYKTSQCVLCLHCLEGPLAWQTDLEMQGSLYFTNLYIRATLIIRLNKKTSSRSHRLCRGITVQNSSFDNQTTISIQWNLSAGITGLEGPQLCSPLNCSRQVTLFRLVIAAVSMHSSHLITPPPNTSRHPFFMFFQTVLLGLLAAWVERWPLVRRSMTCIHAICCHEFVYCLQVLKGRPL